MADPGFSPRRGRQPSGRQDTVLVKFPENSMKLKKIRPGGASPTPPLDPPPCDGLKSFTSCTISCNPVSERGDNRAASPLDA